MTSPAPRAAGTSSCRADLLLLALLVAVVCVIASSGMSAPKILDDLEETAHVATFRSWTDCFGTDCYHLFRPFKNLAFYALKDASLATCHVFTLLMYVLAAGGVYALFRRMIGSPGWAFTGALLWATCPTHVSTAVWLSAFNLSLALALACACVICHDLAREGPGRRLGMTALACILLFAAQLSYETAVAVPGLCVLIDLLRKRAVFSRESIARYAVMGLITLIYLIIRSRHGAAGSVQDLNYGFSPDMKAWQLSISAPWLLWKHFLMWIMPIGRIEFGSTYIWGKSAAMWELAVAWLWLLLLLGACWLCRKRLPLVTIGILWFLAASFPPSNFVPIWSGPIEDYYLIFPSVGLVLILLGCAQPLIAWMKRHAGDHAPQRRLIGGGLLFIAAVWRLMLVPLFWLQADLWNQPLRLYLLAEQSRPHQFQLQNAIAKELILLGNFEEAKKYATWSYQDGPWSPASSMILGYLAYEEGDLETAEKNFALAVTLSSPGARIHDFARLHLAKIAIQHGVGPEPVRSILLPLLENKDGTQHLAAIRTLAECYLEHKAPDAAQRAVQKALQMHPGNAQLMELEARIRKSLANGGDGVKEQPPSAPEAPP